MDEFKTFKLKCFCALCISIGIGTRIIVSIEIQIRFSPLNAIEIDLNTEFCKYLLEAQQIRNRWS